MAKHAHKLILLNKKTWRCMIEGCSFFVHLGLAHVLIGKQAICWQCEEAFQVAPWTLKDEKPICDDCRTIGIAEWVEEKLSKKPVTELEVIEPEIEHAPDCAIYEGGECTCQ